MKIDEMIGELKCLGDRDRLHKYPDLELSRDQYTLYARGFKDGKIMLARFLLKRFLDSIPRRRILSRVPLPRPRGTGTRDALESAASYVPETPQDAT